MELVIQRSKWLRGEGSLYSSLLRPDDRKMCCLGFYSLACGFTEEKIEGQDAPNDLVEIGSETPRGFEWLFADDGYHSRTATALMRINDAKLNQVTDDIAGPIAFETEKQREKRIAEIFAEHGVTVRFED